MHARVTTLEGAPDKIDDATSHLREQTLPQLRKMDGYKGFVALGDRRSGKVLGVAFWESEEALRATEVEVAGVRSGAAEALGGTVAGVEQYEVIALEAPSAGPGSGGKGTGGDNPGGGAGPVGGGPDPGGGGTVDRLGGGGGQAQ